MAESGHHGSAAIVAALVGNLLISVTKGAAAFVTGSGSLMAETAHSFADTLNQVFLLIGVRNSARGPSVQHPLGYGRERYFWSLVVALMLFFGGGVFSLYEGYLRLVEPHEITSAGIGLAVLGAAFVFESGSLLFALREAAGRAREEGIPLLASLRTLSDPALRTVLFEDSAALIGLVLAAAFLGLSVVTGDHRWDAGGSASVGALLVVVALILARDARSLIIGESPPPEVVDSLRATLAAAPAVDQVLEVSVVRVGADRLFVGARLSLRDELTVGEAEIALAAIRLDLMARYRDVSNAYLELTPAE